MKKTADRLCEVCGLRNEVEIRELFEGSSCKGCRGRLRPLAKPLPVDASSLEAIVKGTRLPVLTDIQIKGSNEEREQRPALDKVAEHLEGKLVVTRLDAHEERELCIRSCAASSKYRPAATTRGEVESRRNTRLTTRRSRRKS